MWVMRGRAVLILAMLKGFGSYLHSLHLTHNNNQRQAGAPAGGHHAAGLAASEGGEGGMVVVMGHA